MERPLDYIKVKREGNKLKLHFYPVYSNINGWVEETKKHKLNKKLIPHTSNSLNYYKYLITPNTAIIFQNSEDEIAFNSISELLVFLENNFVK